MSTSQLFIRINYHDFILYRELNGLWGVEYYRKEMDKVQAIEMRFITAIKRTTIWDRIMNEELRKSKRKD